MKPRLSYRLALAWWIITQEIPYRLKYLMWYLRWRAPGTVLVLLMFGCGIAGAFWIQQYIPPRLGDMIRPPIKAELLTPMKFQDRWTDPPKPIGEVPDPPKMAPEVAPIAEPTRLTFSDGIVCTIEERICWKKLVALLDEKDKQDEAMARMPQQTQEELKEENHPLPQVKPKPIEKEKEKKPEPRKKKHRRVAQSNTENGWDGARR